MKHTCSIHHWHACMHCMSHPTWTPITHMVMLVYMHSCLYICMCVWSVYMYVCMSVYTFHDAIYDNGNKYWPKWPLIVGMWLAFCYIFFYKCFWPSTIYCYTKKLSSSSWKGGGPCMHCRRHQTWKQFRKLGRHSGACLETLATEHGWHDIKNSNVFRAKIKEDDCSLSLPQHDDQHKEEEYEHQSSYIDV